MKTPQSNQATSKLLGFIYQVLVAIEKCFNADVNKTIYIECYGDVADDKCSTEVKHHLNDGNLTDNSVDFWNTLKNVVKEDTEGFERLVLHTTHEIPEEGIFYGWNEKSATAKYNALKACKPTKTIKEHYDYVFNHMRKELLPTLKKLEVYGSQLKIDEFLERLQDHQLLCLAPSEERKNILLWLNGYMFERAIEDHYRWHVDINEFRKDLSTYASQFHKNNMQFPYVKESDINTTSDNSFRFLRELENIGVKKPERLTAISDYLRMKQSEVELLTKKPLLMEEAIFRYEDAVSKRVSNYKSSLGRKLTTDDLGTNTCKSISVDVYFDFKLSEKIDIVHVENTEEYFMTGKAHHLVECNQVNWEFVKEDLE